MQIIFIHGSGGCKESWQFQTDYFKGSEALNLPGHPDGDLCPTIEQYVAWLHNQIEAKGYKDVVLVGHSLGGGIALQHALDFPQDLKAIVLVGSGARLKVHPDFIAMLEKAEEDEHSFDDFLRPMNKAIRSELIDILDKRSRENGPASFVNDLKACDRFDIMERISEIRLPVLALCGDQDIMTPPKYSHYLAANLHNAEVVVIPGATHMVFAEKPAEVNSAIESFLKKL